MPISQSTIFGSVKKPDGSDAQISGIRFTLSGSDFEGPEWIAANTVSGTTVSTEGDFSITLWPNDRGVNGDTMYSAALQFTDGSSVDLPNQLRVEYSPVPRSIGQLVAETRARGQVAPSQLRMMTRAQFDALLQTDPNTAYLIVRPEELPASLQPAPAPSAPAETGAA